MTADADVVESLVRTVAADMGRARGELAAILQDKLASGIVELQGDPVILDLLFGSIAGNLDIFVHTLQTGGSLENLSAPPAALEYARRLAQRGTTPNALLRAYRLGQAAALAWALRRIEEVAPDPRTGAGASARFVELSFAYIDSISEQVVHEYDSERVRWLSRRSAEGAAILRDLLDQREVDVTAAESTLGYRLRQHHVGVVIWHDPAAKGSALAGLEQCVGQLAAALGSSGTPLFAAQDQSTAWAWIPFARTSAVRVDERALSAALPSGGMQVALGGVAAGPDGFRTTHLQAVAARGVAMVAGGLAPAVTSWTHPEMRAAVMLAADMDATRDLVRHSLGGLAADDEATARLRQTVLEFLSRGSSYAATAKAMHVHLNTMKYRINRAVELRGRPVDDGRLDLELALIACKWLGAAHDAAGWQRGQK